ncbi:MAG: twin-arginine translocation signal domain-containing protein, partial [Roseiflexaceae bacterium]
MFTHAIYHSVCSKKNYKWYRFLLVKEHVLSKHDILARRRFLQLSAALGAGAVMAACGVSTTSTPTAEPTTTPEAT